MRDLQKDLEICNKATPGPWLPGHLPDIEQDCEICKINAFYNKNVNREFVAQAREGWPHAIGRAIKAEAEVARLAEINQGCEQEARLYDDLLHHCRAENAKLCAVVDAARAYLDQINKRTKSMGLDMSNYHALSITVKPGDAGKDYWQAVWALQQALTELDKEGER